MEYRNILNFSSYTQIFEQEAAGTTGAEKSGTETEKLALKKAEELFGSSKGASGASGASGSTGGTGGTGAAGETSGTVKTISEVISLFFKCYMFAATKTSNYPDVLADLLSVSDEKDPAKRADKMEAVIKKVSDKMDAKYAPVKEEANKAASSIKDLYNNVASTEEAKKYNDVINKMVTSKIISYQDILKNQPLKENRNVSPYKNLLGFDNYHYPSLYEKNTFDDERDALSDKMKSIYSEMISQQKNPSSETLKAKASEVISKFDEYQKLLSDKGAWEKMKRKERKNKLESMNSEIDEIIQKTNDLQKSELTKIGVDKKIADTMSTIITSINSMSDKAKEIDDEASSLKVRVEFVNELLAILVNVLDEPLIVLFVKVVVPESTYVLIAFSVGTAKSEFPDKVPSILNSLIEVPSSAPIEPNCNSVKPDKSKASAFNVATPVDC